MIATRDSFISGPAIWLRCVLAGTLPEIALPKGTLVVYLPGVGRADLRAVEDCPKELQPLAELQYRGIVFSGRKVVQKIFQRIP